ncbi:MAG: ABC transporter ATP-binding protein [Lachnospiraceae bacterium]|nr:ABC transporter ATP-binding protein [Lachnospiraceae bacterium]
MNLRIRDVHKFYGEQESRIEVLKGIDCEVSSGEICVLLGPSGSGKSTLLNIIGGIETMDSGSIEIGDERIEKLDEAHLTEYRRNYLGFVFQFYNLIPNLTIRENIEVCAYLSRRALDIDELLETLGLSEHADKLPSQVSGGQQQRCAIGRALVKNPALLLCDEPTGALDYKTSKEILELIERINAKYHNTVIIVTHNEAIRGMAHRVLKLRDGRIVRNYVNESVIAARDLEW